MGAITHDEPTASLTGQDDSAEPDSPIPAVIAVATLGEPACFVFPLIGNTLIMGRELQQPLSKDRAISRQQTEIGFASGQWLVKDLGSTHGTFLDGARITGPASTNDGAVHVVRVGRTILLLEPNAARFGRAKMEATDVVIGPALRPIFDRAARLADAGRDVLITGEMGTGKEVVARYFHQRGPNAAGPFIPILGGADLVAQVREAEGGVVFFDEIGDLSADQQVQVLRLLQFRELQDGSGARRVDVRVSAASRQNLDDSARRGAFRPDLLERLYGEGHVHVLPLRGRREEIPFLIDHALKRYASMRVVEGVLTCSDELVERCLLHSWTGNVRGLMGAIARAATDALAENLHRVALRHLLNAVKRQSDFIREEREDAPRVRPAAPAPAPAPDPEAAQKAELLRMYAESGFDASDLAKALNEPVADVTRRLDRYGANRQKPARK